MPKRVVNDQPRQRTFIAEWRKFRRHNQDALAEALGVDKASVSRVETGKHPYTQDFLEVSARFLGTDVVSLISKDPSAPDNRDDVDRVADALRAAPEPLRTTIINNAKFLLEIP